MNISIKSQSTFIQRSTMKSIAGILVISLALFQMVEMRKNFFEECANELNLSKDDLHNMHKGTIPENAKCFHKCMMEKMGAMKDGALDEKQITEFLAKHPEKENMATKFSECKQSKGADACELANNYHDCMGFGKH